MSEEEAKPIEPAEEEESPGPVPAATETPEAKELRAKAESEAQSAIQGTLMRLGFVNFDTTSADNTTFGAMVAPDWRKHFKRDVYVGIKDKEQSTEFLGRIVEGPFHAPHERSEEQRLNSSHITISYAVFCLKKKKK